MDSTTTVESTTDERWLSKAVAAIGESGFAIVEGVLSTALIERLRGALYLARERILSEVGEERIQRANELGTVRIPMRYDLVFLELLELPEVLAVVDATVSKTAILHLQNGLILPHDTEGKAASSPPKFHRDFPRYLNGYLASVNTLFAVDEFTERNGGTLVAPRTQQRPEPPRETGLTAMAIPVVCPAGSMLVFDSTLWHAAGHNRSTRDRLAINQQFTRSFFKQQIDYVRALGGPVVEGLEPRTQQLLGWYTRVVTSLDEFYRPPDERLYRAGQG